MTDNPWPSIAITAALIAIFGFLIVRGQHIAARRRARINQRITAERNPACRAAWRTIRDRHQGDDQ